MYEDKELIEAFIRKSFHLVEDAPNHYIRAANCAYIRGLIAGAFMSRGLPAQECQNIEYDLQEIEDIRRQTLDSSVVSR